MKTIKLTFPELGISCDVDVKKLQEARKLDHRGYATFNALDSDSEEVCVSGSKGNPVVVQMLLNDTTVKSKGAGKKARKILSAE
jgi:hypothetical protein